jgi:hypothetical protein
MDKRRLIAKLKQGIADANEDAYAEHTTQRSWYEGRAEAFQDVLDWIKEDEIST